MSSPQSRVGLDAKLNDPKISFSEKVTTILNVWENVASYSESSGETDKLKSLIEWAAKHTHQLVLRPEWPTHVQSVPVTKTHFSVTLQRCVTQLAQRQHPGANRCEALQELVQDPWGTSAQSKHHIILSNILYKQTDAEIENEEDFCYKEKGELLKMRLKMLCEGKLEGMALNLAAACVRSLRRSSRLYSVSDQTQINYMIDVYIVLLYKKNRIQDILAQLELMDLKDVLEMMQRLSGEKPTQYGTAKIWLKSRKAAGTVAGWLVTKGMVKPLSEVSRDVLEQILNSWALLHAMRDEKNLANLIESIRAFIKHAESAEQIYVFCEVLIRNFDDALKPLVIELYIRALTTDMNELESQKFKSNKEKVQETAQRLSREFLRLADYVSNSVSTARECVLTAFSLHPTRECYERIKALAIACGKTSPEVKDEQRGDVTVAEVKAETSSGSEQGLLKEEEIDQSSIARIIGVYSPNKSTTKEEPTGTKDTVAKDKPATQLFNDSTSQTNNCHSQQNSVMTASNETPANTAETKVKSDPEQRVEAPSIQRDQLTLAKNDTVTSSSNYDEKVVSNQGLEILGISPQLCDDLAVVLNSQRNNELQWYLPWNKLNELCERILQNPEDMLNTNKELKYLNIDYSQFKNQPFEDDFEDTYAGIEKGYEQWNDSDFSESEICKKAPIRKTNVRRSLDNSSDTDSGNVVVPPKKGRSKKVPRLNSSDSDREVKFKKKHRQRYQKVLVSSSDSDTNTQDSQTDSLGSDGFKKNSKKFSKKPLRQVFKSKPPQKRIIVESASHFRMLVNENIRPSGDNMSNSRGNDIMTLISMDENHETLKGIAALNAMPFFAEKRSDPAVIKSLRMVRIKKPSQINDASNQLVTNNVSNECASIKKNIIVVDEITPERKFAPMLSTLNLLPKIPLRRVDEIEKKFTAQQLRQVKVADVKKELSNIQKTMPLFENNAVNGVSKQSLKNVRKKFNSNSMKPDLEKSNLKSFLTNSVPGMRSMEFSVLPQVQSTVQVVQLQRNIPQSPNSSASSNNTPPRVGVRNSNIQLPGTPSSGGHDSGVGMSPAGQTPPPPTRTSGLQDVSEEANQPPDTSPRTAVDSTNATVNTTENSRTAPVAVLNQRTASNHSPKKSTSSTVPNQQQPQQPQQQHQMLVKQPDGTYHLLQTSPNILAGQRQIVSLQNFEDGNISFTQRIPVATVVGSGSKTAQSPGNRNTGLPKFQQAFGKTICTLNTESSSTSATDSHDGPATSSAVATNAGQRVNSKNVNMSKAVQTAVPNLQVAAGTRQILNIVQAATGNSATTNASGQTLLVPNSTPGVIYTHKLPGTNQLINLSNKGGPVQFRLNILKPIRSTPQTIQVLTSRLPQQTQQQPQQTQAQQPQTQQQQQSQSQQQTHQQASRAATTSDSETLEQLREFESVLEQVKERSTSSQSSSSDTTTVQTQTQQGNSTTPKGQQLIMTQGEFTGNGSGVTFQQQEVYPQKVALMYSPQNNVSPSAAVTTSKVVSPVVVVTSYCQPGPSSSPAPSVTSQSSSSPCVTPAPSTTPTVVSTAAASGKSTTTQTSSQKSSAKKSPTKTAAVKVSSAPSTPKASPLPKPQQKPQEDPETTQRIYAILGQYAEQLRNSPDLNNKPAPRRRSNPPTNPQSSKRKKSGSGKSKSASGQQTSEPSPSADDMGRTMGSSEDSSGGGNVAGGSGMMHMDSPAGFSADEAVISSNNNSQSGMTDNANLGSGSEMKMSNTSDSNDSGDVNMKRRNILFAEPNAGQTRAVIVQEGATSVSEALASVTSKMTTGTAVLVSGTNFMLPMNFVKSGQQITVVSGGSKLLAAVPAVRTSTGASNIANTFVLQSLLSQANKVIQHQNTSKPVKLTTATGVQPGQIVIPHSGSIVRFASELDNNNPDIKVEVKSEGANKTPATTTIAGLLQQSGVITTNSSQQRVFNSSSVKLAVKSDNPQIMRLLAPIKTELDQKPDVDNMVQKDIKSEVVEEEKFSSMKVVKRKEEQSILAGALTQGRPESSQLLSKKIKQSISPVPAVTPTPILTSTTTTSSSNFDATSQQFFVTGGPSSSDSQESGATGAMETSSMDGVTKVGNGVLCGNARLQEAWEPEQKGSPDTPWRYIPSSVNALDNVKVYSHDGETSETVNTSVLQILNKGQGIEMSSGGIFQTKKYYNSVEFQKFAKVLNKTASTVSNPSNNLTQESQQQKINDRKQQLLERELRLQKSLSEECEDLGVDEPSTSDLFPEADLNLFDTNHSPAFDHSSQEASCSQSLNNPKPFANTATFFKSVDSSSAGSREASPVVSVQAKKKTPVPRRTTKPKESPAKKNKRNSESVQTNDATSANAKKQKLSPNETRNENLSQNEASSNTRVSSASENDSTAKETTSQKVKNVIKSFCQIRVANKNKETVTQQVKQEVELGTQSVVSTNPVKVERQVVDMNNVSPTISLSENDTTLNLLEDNVSIDCPLTSIPPTMMTHHNEHRYTYTNNKKKPVAKIKANDFFSIDSGAASISWESPMSERTRSSSEECDEVNEEIGETLSLGNYGTVERTGIGNGLQNTSSVKSVSLDHATYSAKRKTPILRRTANKDSSATLNKSADSKQPTSQSAGPKKPVKTMPTSTTTSPPPPAVVSLPTPSLTPTTEIESLSPAPSSDKLSESHPSDEDISTLAQNDNCSAVRRSSRKLEGHGKKESCALTCCKSLPERPKGKKVATPKSSSGQTHQHQHQHQHQLQQQAQGDGNNHNVTPAKVKKIKQTHQHASQQMQQQKPLVKKR